MKKPANLNTVSEKTNANTDRKDALIARLIAGAELDFGCCGHAKPKERSTRRN